MVEIITRRCDKCKEDIEINIDDIKNLIFFEKKYYHKECFRELAEKRILNARCSPKWGVALRDINKLELEIKENLLYRYHQDKLNAWLLEHYKEYNVVRIPDPFWPYIAQLHHGEYKGKKCNPIKIEVIVELWKWGQAKLDMIALNNASNHKGPKNLTSRLRYDLAILVRHFDEFKKHQNNIKAMEAESKIAEKEDIKINYDKIKTVSTNDGLDDISSLLDELI